MVSKSLRILAVLLLTGLLAGQQPQTIRVTTRLVLVSVVARNGAGEPVTDLSKEDFQLFDNGKPQVTSFFSLETRKPPATIAKALPEHTYSNRVENGIVSEPGVVIVLFDLLNTEFTDQSYARQQLVRVMKQIQPGERIGIYMLGRKLTVLHDFTDDPAQLAAVLARFVGESSRQLSGAQANENATPVDLSSASLGPGRGSGSASVGQPGPTVISPQADPFAEVIRLLKGGQKVAEDFYNVDRARVTFGAFEGIAKHVGVVPGRKSLVWISGSFPFTLGVGLEDQQNLRTDSANREYRSLQPEFERATDAVNQANLAVYPVDARGLIASSEYSALTPAGVGRQRPRTTDTTIPNLDTLKNMAAMTGGRAFYNTNDIGNAVSTAIDDGRVTYTVGFYPSSPADDKFHTLKIQVKRKGVNIRYREGYLALARTESSADPKVELQKAITNPVETAAIGLTVKIERLAMTGADWSLLTNIDAHDLVVEEKDKKWVGHLQVVYSAQAETGKELGGMLDTIDLDLKPEVWARLQAMGLPLQKKFRPPAGASKVRIAVYDLGTGRMGSISVPLAMQK